jgi:Flp pilus assembly protein TadG
MKIILSEAGSTLLESALVLPLFLGMLFGIMMMCLGLYAYDFTAEAARLGARYAMVRGSACTAFASACPASSDDVQTYIRGLDFPGINASSIQATTTWPTTGSACTPSSSPCNNPGNLVHVYVQYSVTLAIPFVKNIPLTLSSTSQMVISN